MEMLLLILALGWYAFLGIAFLRYRFKYSKWPTPSSPVFHR